MKIQSLEDFLDLVKSGAEVPGFLLKKHSYENTEDVMCDLVIALQATPCVISVLFLGPVIGAVLYVVAAKGVANIFISIVFLVVILCVMYWSCKTVHTKAKEYRKRLEALLGDLNKFR